MTVLARFIKTGLSRATSTRDLQSRGIVTSFKDIYYNEDQIKIQNTTKKIIQGHIIPNYDTWEKEGIFPGHKVFKIFGDAGLLGINKPEEFGGLGLSYKYALASLECLGDVPGYGFPLAYSVHTEMATPALAKFGSDELRREFLEPSMSGDYIASIGITEPSAGSDVAAIKTTARRQGDDLIINGQKLWITNFSQSDWICLLANTSEGHPHKNKSLICVPMNSKGVTRGEKLRKLGVHISDTGPIFFENVRVPAKNIIGKEGLGFIYQMLQFQEERLGGSAPVVGLLDQALDKTIDYAKQRMIFGQPVINNQYIHYRLSELKSEIEGIRALLYLTTDGYIAGNDMSMMTSILKLKLGRVCREVTDSCLQVWGAMGFSEDTVVSRLYRDLRMVSIGAGVDEVMISIISKYMDLVPKPKKKK